MKNNKRKTGKIVLSILSGLFAVLTIFFFVQIVVKANTPLFAVNKNTTGEIENNYIEDEDEDEDKDEYEDNSDDEYDYDYEDDDEDDDQSERIHDEMVFEAYYTFLYEYYDDYTDDDMYARVGFYDIDDDGTNEMIISYGHGSYDWTNEIYAINDDEEVCYLGEELGEYVFYSAEDGDGLYLVYGLQGFQSIRRLTVNSSGDEIIVKTISDDFLEEDEDYYENDYPVDFVELDTYLGYD